jgi:GR25 family glycosyltransferase involved in LPS biosynthesis
MTREQRKKTKVAKHPLRNAEASVHTQMIQAIHPELTEVVNKFLAEKKIPVSVHEMHFGAAASPQIKCCTINGRTVCGPQCF